MMMRENFFYRSVALLVTVTLLFPSSPTGAVGGSMEPFACHTTGRTSAIQQTLGSEALAVAGAARHPRDFSYQTFATLREERGLLEYEPPEPFDGEIARLPNGRQISYRRYGNPNAPPERTAVYFHGNGMSRLEPEAFNREGLEDWCIIAVDMPGAGASSVPAKNAVGQWVTDFGLFAEKLALTDFQLNAHSGGAPWALACAASDGLRSKISRLKLISPIGPPERIWRYPVQLQTLYYVGRLYDHLWVGQFLLRGLSILWIGLMTSDHYTSWQKTFHRFVVDWQAEEDQVLLMPAQAEIYQSWRASFERKHPEGWLRFIAALTRPWHLDWNAISCPVEVYHGKNDKTVPYRIWEEIAEQNKAKIRLTPVEDGGHFFILRDFSKIIRDQMTAQPSAPLTVSPAPAGLISGVSRRIGRFFGGEGSLTYRWGAGPSIEELIGFGSLPLAIGWGLHYMGISSPNAFLASMGAAILLRITFVRFHPYVSKVAAYWISALTVFIPPLVAYHFDFSKDGVLLALGTSIALHSAVNFFNDMLMLPHLEWWRYQMLILWGRLRYRTRPDGLHQAYLEQRIRDMTRAVQRDLVKLQRKGRLWVGLEDVPEDPRNFEEHFVRDRQNSTALHLHFYDPDTGEMLNGATFLPKSTAGPYRLEGSHLLMETFETESNFLKVTLETPVAGLDPLTRKINGQLDGSLRRPRSSRQQANFRRTFRMPEQVLLQGIHPFSSRLYNMVSRYQYIYRLTAPLYTDPFSLITFRALNDLNNDVPMPAVTLLAELQSILMAWTYSWNEATVPYHVLMPSVLETGPWLDLIALMPKAMIMNFGLISPDAKRRWEWPWDGKAAAKIEEWPHTVHFKRPLHVYGTDEEFRRLKEAMKEKGRQYFPMRHIPASVFEGKPVERLLVYLFETLRNSQSSFVRHRLLNVYSIPYVLSLLRQIGPLHGLPREWLDGDRPQHPLLAAA